MPTVVKLLQSKENPLRSIAIDVSLSHRELLPDLFHNCQMVSVHLLKRMMKLEALTTETTVAPVWRISNVVTSPRLDSRCIIGITADDRVRPDHFSLKVG
jgi:hypothetical protein